MAAHSFRGPYAAILWQLTALGDRMQRYCSSSQLKGTVCSDIMAAHSFRGPYAAILTFKCTLAFTALLYFTFNKSAKIATIT